MVSSTIKLRQNTIIIAKANQLSQEQVLKTLANIGFDEVDAQIYLYLAKKGMKKASDIYKSLKLTKQQFYPSIKRLQSKGILKSTIEHPARFSVLPFEKVLDTFIKAKFDEARVLEQNKKEILANWENLSIEDDTSAKFTVIQGRTFIYSKIQQMIQETRDQILLITTVPTLVQADQRDVFEAFRANPLRSKVEFRFLAELSEQTVKAMKSFLSETANFKLNVKGRNPDLGLALSPQMTVRDAEEALFFTKSRDDTSIIEKDDVCLWTNSKPLIKAFTAIFEELWHRSTDIQEKITEIETGKLCQKTLIIENAEASRKMYNKTLKSAKKEILISTSAKGLIEILQNNECLSEWSKRKVAIKVLAPIVDENLEASKHLAKIFSVKHVPPNYLPTTIIDGKHLFQFKKNTPENQMNDSALLYESALYTTSPEYVQKTMNTLNELWKNSSPQPNEELKGTLNKGILSHNAYAPGAILSPGPYGKSYPLPPQAAKADKYDAIEIVNEDPLGKLKEQDVLNEIINSQKVPLKNQLGIWKVFSSQAIATIHPPDFFNLPPFLIRVHHVEKHSTWGPEEVVIVNLWMETPNGQAYVPVAVLCEGPNAEAHWKMHFTNTPAGQNVRLAKTDELQIRMHGNTLFAGWTVPIPLLPAEYVLPPACVVFEGYGDVKTEAYSVVQPMGGKFTVRQNGFDAFVSFMHPSSKYSGPGTDGFLVRDFVMEGTVQFIDGYHPTLETKLVRKETKKE
jgi:sugar-specific transcriptional regulator TrmB